MKRRILFIYPWGEPISVSNPKKNIFYHLSKKLTGDLLQPVWYEKNAETVEISKKCRQAMGEFDYHPLYTRSARPVFFYKIFRDLFYYVKTGLSLNRSKGYDVIVSYGTFTTAFGGYILKLLTRKKLIIFVVVRLKGIYRYTSRPPLSMATRIKCKTADIINQWMLNTANRIWLIDPNCADGFKIRKDIPRSIFMDFVSVSSIPMAEESSKYILLMGGTWYRKGVDILIEAFKLISPEFPEYKLKIFSFGKDRKDGEYFRRLSKDNDKMELCRPVPHDEAMKLMSKCYCYVMASRSEGGGSRVLIEAMAARKPIVAVNAEGSQFVIKHGFSGLLFEQNNVKDLADKIKTLLKSPDYAAELSKNAYDFAHKNLSEDNYVENFNKMIEETCAQ